MSQNNWKTMPLGLLILQSIEKREGIILDNELLLMVEQELGYRPSPAEFTKELITLEITGRIVVTNFKKNQRKITFLKKEQSFLAIGED
jgi:hypothetical protein